ncbi:carbohydrate ABC transporter permease [Phytoactinopolyspora halotolerans]|uniref:Carbohydrate ABC transporter permease n=2 Tax=Phytoactinopolyspora halotolerans TaxID=1981512 RepID=A0A6L9SE00_9ACTN|nr:carbohydrate ABC transporter permease [Phytoactinopolyspora halotolerans]
MWNALAVVLALIWAFPVYWMVNSSFLPFNRIRNPDPTFIPLGGTLSAYERVFDSDFLASLRTSLMVTLITVAAALLFAFLAALALSRFRFRGRRTFVLAVLVIQMIPAEGLFISQFKLLEGWQLLNSVVGLSLLYIAAVVPFTIWMLRGFVAGVPRDLEEAALVDGCSRAQAFFRITFPLLAPGLVASGVYAFLQAWNEFTLALVIMTRPENMTLPLWLRTFTDANRASDWAGIMAGSALIAIPVIVFFLFVQNRMTSGLVSGAVKG